MVSTYLTATLGILASAETALLGMGASALSAVTGIYASQVGVTTPVVWLTTSLDAIIPL